MFFHVDVCVFMLMCVFFMLMCVCFHVDVFFSSAHQRKLLRKSPEHLDESRILKVAIIGAPNAGKSTLANTLMGWRVRMWLITCSLCWIV